jgi:AI-2 transport protein TqsA
VWEMLAVIVVYCAINFVIQSVIQPKFQADALNLGVSLTFLSLVFWTFVLGPLGALLALPMTLFVKAVLVDSDPTARWVDPLLSLVVPSEGPPDQVAEQEA